MHFRTVRKGNVQAHFHAVIHLADIVFERMHFHLRRQFSLGVSHQPGKRIVGDISLILCRDQSRLRQTAQNTEVQHFVLRAFALFPFRFDHLIKPVLELDIFPLDPFDFLRHLDIVIGICHSAAEHAEHLVLHCGLLPDFALHGFYIQLTGKTVEQQP